MTFEIVVILGVLFWVGIFVRWWLSQMLFMERPNKKVPKKWHIVRSAKPRRFHQWFEDYPYDKFDSGSSSR